jgi:hypothetical protein
MILRPNQLTKKSSPPLLWDQKFNYNIQDLDQLFPLFKNHRNSIHLKNIRSSSTWFLLRSYDK